MSDTKGKSKTEVVVSSLKEKFDVVTDALWEMHQEKIARMIDESKVAKGTVGFTLSIDYTQSAPTAEIGIKFGKPTTDSRKLQLADPDQGVWEEMTKTPTKKKGGDGEESD